MKIHVHFYIEDTHLPPKISKFIQHSLDHSYCKRENSLTKLKNSKSVMILVVRLTSSPIPNSFWYDTYNLWSVIGRFMY
jgi:hypothetical protein